MPKIDMSPQAITTRLKRTEQLRRLGLSLRKAKIKSRDIKSEVNQQTSPTKPDPNNFK